MTWQDYLTSAERKLLAAAKATRDKARDAYNALRSKLKNRAEARMRAERARRGE